MTVTNLALFKRSNGFWYILYTADGRKRWKSTKCADRSSALKKLTEFQEFVSIKPIPIRLSAFTQEFLLFAKPTYARGSVDLFNIALRNLRLVTGDCMLTTITQRHVDRYKAERLGCVRPTSVNVELRTLRTILNLAVRWGLIETNPFAKVQLVKIPESSPLFFKKDEFDKFMTVVAGHWIRDLFVFVVLTGLRRGEILDLRWADVNLEERVLNIQSSSTHRVKSGKRRTIPLSDSALLLLSKRQVLSKSEFVFERDGEKIRGNYVTKTLKKVVRCAGLNDRLHFHSLRHTFATWLAQDRVSIYEIQKLLGHSDISMTQVYSHLVTSELHDAVNRIRL